MTRQLPGAFSLLALGVSLFGADAVHAATALRTLDVDLAARIDVAVTKRERFAVDVPHAVTLEAGSWEREGETSTWRYSVRIPTAVSMSFHADRFALPPGAVLTVSNAAGTPLAYGPLAAASSELWSRIASGNTLSFELSVPTAEESRVEFSIASLQAGFRSLGGAVPNHPHFEKLQKAQAAAGAAAAAEVCIENFACHATPENTPSADATAAIVIGGVSLCSATLVNNLRNDGTPYLLTARHCQDGPASNVTVYWDAAAPCGAPLGTIYDTRTQPHQLYSPQTVFEQQDVWMINVGAVASAHAYFAGWDVTGGTFIGGYSPHHALGRARQFARWTGQAALVNFPRSVLGNGFDSTFWGVVNDVGSVGSGASGGGLFNMEHRLVGIASLAFLQNGPGSDGACPVTPAPVPTADSAKALYSSLSAVWESNADTTSFTNPVTLKSLLDPDNTGRRTSDGFELLRNMTLTRSEEVAETGWSRRLEWNAPGAASCVATGGFPGDGWAGTRAASGSLLLVQYDPSITTYSMRCANGARYAERSVQINWIHKTPFADLQTVGGISAAVVGFGTRLQWRSTVRPCVASGGGAGDGWAGPKAEVMLGEQDVPFTQDGLIEWTITCGSGARTVSKTVTSTIYPVAVELRASAATMRVNEPVYVLWPMATGTSCQKTGGAPGDGWAGPLYSSGNSRTYTSAVAGTFRYTVTCTGGGHTATDSADITFTNDAPVATLAASDAAPHVTPPEPPASYPGGYHPNSIVLSWTSNMAPCYVAYDGPGNEDAPIFQQLDGGFAVDSLHDLRTVAGTYVYTVTCGAGATKATATTTVDWLPNAPVVTLHVLDTNVTANDTFFLAWNGNVSYCTRSGGVAGDGWAGGPGLAAGSVSVMLQQVGSYNYHVSCGAGGDVVEDDITITVPPHAVTFLPHVAQARVRDQVSLGWSSTVMPCFFMGDTTALAAHSAWSVGAAGPGIQTYTVRCGTAEATTQIEWLPPITVDVTVTANEVAVGRSVTVSWTSANAQQCSVLRGPYLDWAGDLPLSGSRTFTRLVPTSALFSVSCDGVEDFVHVNWLGVNRSPDPFPSPNVTLTIDSAAKVAGENVTISWTSTHAAGCTGLEGATGDQWAGTLPVSGTRTIRVNTAGTYRWGIQCQGAPPVASASVSAVFSPAPVSGSPSGGSSSSSSSGGGKGGGGRLDLWLLALLASMVMMAAGRVGRQRRRE